MNSSDIPKKPSDYLSWAISQTNTEAQEFADMLTAAQFWQKWGGKVEKLDTGDAVGRAIAMAKYDALARAFGIHTIVDQAQVVLTFDAKKEGWHHNIPAEYQSIVELIASVTDGVEAPSNESSRRDLVFVVDELFPALVRAGVDVDKIVNIKDRWSKLRVAIPFLRTAIKKVEKKDTTDEEWKELGDYMNGMFGMIADDTSVRDLRAKLHEKKDIVDSHPTVKGDLYQTGTNRYLFVAEVDGEGAEWLAKVLRFSIMDVLKPFSKLTDLISFIKGLV